jgi:ACS family D-galactonate transporter-like MFS transporter
MFPNATTAGHTTARRSSVRWRIFGIVFVLVVINMTDRTTLSIAMPTIAKEFATSPALHVR